MLQTSSLRRPVNFLLLFFLVVAGLYFARPFLVPVCFGGLLAMLFLPASRWLESKGVPRALAILICILFFVSICVGIIWLISWQVTDLTSEVSHIEQKVKDMIKELKEYINKNFGISSSQQDQMINSQKEGGSNAAQGILSDITSWVMSFLVDFILVLVYIFLFIYYRTHIKKFVLQLVPESQKNN